MDVILSFPSRTYHYIELEYGSIGLIVAGLATVVGAVCFLTWVDRRK